MLTELRPLPDSFAATREALHRVAEELVAPARKPHNEIALRQTPGGFGTPEFDFGGTRTQVRVVGADLVLTAGADERRIELTTLAEGGALLGPELLPDGIPDDRTPLRIDPEAAERLADYYAFARGMLESLRGELADDTRPSEINLWPEHFDIALEAGSEDAGQRATYGGSPGDEDHPEPYLYVGPWTARVEGELWNARGFSGAELGYADLLGAGDPGAAALEFFRSRTLALSAQG